MDMYMPKIIDVRRMSLDLARAELQAELGVSPSHVRVKHSRSVNKVWTQGFSEMPRDGGAQIAAFGSALLEVLAECLQLRVEGFEGSWCIGIWESGVTLYYIPQ